MAEFKDRLWRELVREHGAELARMNRPPARAGRRVRPRVLAGTTLGLLAIGTTLALVLGATRSSRAFAVDRHADGTVTLTIRRPEGIRGANARLAALGIRVRAVPVEAGCTVKLHDGKVVAVQRAASGPPPGNSALRVTWKRRSLVSGEIDPRKIRRGETLVLPAKPWSSGHVTLVSPKFVHGEAPPCIGPPPPPPAPAQLARHHKVSCHTADGKAVPPPASIPPGPPWRGNSGSGNSGNSGGITCDVGPPPGGDSGSSGNSG